MIKAWVAYLLKEISHIIFKEDWIGAKLEKHYL
jgi:hypothetical protein